MRWISYNFGCRRTIYKVGRRHSAYKRRIYKDLFAIGVADFNQDSLIDVYTINHGFAGLYLENSTGATFEDARMALGLSSNPQFPDAEMSDQGPDVTVAGLYLYWQDGDFHLISRGLTYPGPRRIRLTLNDGIVTKARGKIRLEQTETPDIEFPTRMEVEVGGDGSLLLQSLRWSVNGKIELDPAFDLETVFVGRGRVSPRRHAFDLEAGADTHGVAWTDVNSDGAVDALVIVGGEVGLLNEISALSSTSGQSRGGLRAAGGRYGVQPGVLPEPSGPSRGCERRRTGRYSCCLWARRWPPAEPSARVIYQD